MARIRFASESEANQDAWTQLVHLEQLGHQTCSTIEKDSEARPQTEKGKEMKDDIQPPIRGMNHVNSASIVKVGAGRGFIVEHSVKLPRVRRLRRSIRRRFVVTAAHCLSKMPPASAASYLYERSYKNLLGDLDGNKKDIWAECFFADPVADIAVLGCPDNQELYDQASVYDALVDEVPAIKIGNARNGRGWLLALSGDRWISTLLKVFTGTWGASLETGPTEPGMSGSPILNDAGKAVGVVTIGDGTPTNGVRENHRAGPQPILSRNLPGWMLSP